MTDDDITNWILSQEMYFLDKLGIHQCLRKFAVDFGFYTVSPPLRTPDILGELPPNIAEEGLSHE